MPFCGAGGHHGLLELLELLHLLRVLDEAVQHRVAARLSARAQNLQSLQQPLLQCV